MSEKKKRYEIIEENDKTVKIHFFHKNKIKEYKKITNDDIKLMLETNQDINLSGCYIKNFSYGYVCGLPSDCHSGEIQSRRKILKNFTASNAFFDGEVNFLYAHFGDEKVSFFNTNFGDGKVIFSNAHFGDGGVNFSLTKFGNGDVVFSRAHFGDGKVDFSHAKFGNGKVDFFHAIFGDGDVDFLGAQFGDGDVDFIDAHFGNGDVRFSKAKFGDGDVRFIGVQVSKGSVNFSDASFGNGLFTFHSIKQIEQLNFRISSSDDTIFYFDNCYFSYPVFINIDPIKYLIFYKCTFSNLLSFDSFDKGNFTDKQIALFNITNMGTIMLDWENAKDSIINFDIAKFPIEDRNLSETLGTFLSSCSDEKELNKNKCEELSLIKENYHNQGRYDWEDEAYVEFKKRATIFDKKRLSKKHPFISIYYLISFVIYKAMYPVGKFGTDPISIMGTMILTVLFFGGIYYLPFIDIYPLPAYHYWWSPLYYSAITFFTIGYGDLSAQNGLAAFFSGVEGFLGVFLMGYFSVALVRKILR